MRFKIGLMSFFSIIGTVLGHGNMVYPPVWQDAGGKIGLSSYGHMFIGNYIKFDNDTEKIGTLSLWYTNYTHVEEKTLPDYMRTFANIEPYMEPFIAKNPWMSPGSAPVFSGCGAAGGNPKGCPEGTPKRPGQDCGGDYKGGFSYGPRAEDFDFKNVYTTQWKRGANEEVGWSMSANHGGGYAYRLCKIPEGGRSQLTEECFQSTHLKFASTQSWIQTGKDQSTRQYFTANRTTEGTYPPGSEWTKNPIANCAGLGGGFGNANCDCPKGYQFPPPIAGVTEGQGANYLYKPSCFFGFNIMDEVVVPDDIEVGDYVLSFRWDCEQTPQVWNACSTIKVV